MSHVPVGAFRVTLVRAGVYYWDGGAYLGVVPKTLWSRRMPADERNLVPLSFNCYIVETGEHTVLIETGGGDKMDLSARERMKLPAVLDPLPETIAKQGIDPEQIDIVVNTHLHWDHCGWNTSAAGAALFPRAVYYTRRGEWEHAHERHPRDSVSYIDLNYDPLVESGRMKLLTEDCEVAPGIGLRLAPGHNRDMMVVTAASAGETFCFCSDLIPTLAHVTPTWVAAFDLYPLLSIEMKTRLLEDAARGKWILGFGHDCDVDFARVERDEKGFRGMVV